MDLDKIKVEKAFLERLTASFVLAHLTYHPDTKGKEYREGFDEAMGMIVESCLAVIDKLNEMIKEAEDGIEQA